MRQKYLDVLKAIAIIAVVLYHSSFLPYGYLGVDIFLVIGGYLTTKSLCSKMISDGKEKMGYMSFEVSRLSRLLPVLLLAGIVCMSVGYFVMLPDNYENVSESVIATNFFGNNILAAITTKNYWDVGNNYKPLMHTWYVGLLMQFYLVYPLFFIAANKSKGNIRGNLLSSISVVAFISLLIYFGTTNGAERFYYLPSRFFEFAVGGIAALLYKQDNCKHVFPKWFVYTCYVLLLALLIIEKELMPANIRLVATVALTIVLIVSANSLENRITANGLLAKVGSASFSIFVWHQVVLAFWRYTYESHFSMWSFALYVLIVALLSYITYRFVEQQTNVWLKDIKSKKMFYVSTIVAFFVLTGFAGYIYLNAGVVRDVPELYISKDNISRGMHAKYCDRAYQYDKDFATEKPHWLVIGNSFGRDFVNIINESEISDKVEVSYTNDYKKAGIERRLKNVDRVFISTLGLKESKVTEIEILCLANGCSVDKIVVVGEKNFGESNGQIYAKRGRADYFQQTVKMEAGYSERNERLKAIYGERYLDLIALVSVGDGSVRVFSPDHHFISADCRHLSKGGAIYYGQLINWEDYL